MPDNSEEEFRSEAERPAANLISEFIDFLVHNKRWWLAPILIALLVLSLFVILTSSAAAPFIYSFF